MQIHDHTEHRRLNDGDLVLTANGELRRVSRHKSHPDETWLEHWSTEYSVTLSDDRFSGTDGQTAKELFPLTVVTVVPTPAHVVTDEAATAIQKQIEEGRWVVDPRFRLDLAEGVHLASLLIRQRMALVDEGIGAKDPRPGDDELLVAAVRVARGEFDDHDLWDAYLLSDEEHAGNCTKGYPHRSGGRA